MTGVLELSDWEFKTSALMDRVDSMEEQVGYQSKEVEMLRKIQK